MVILFFIFLSLGSAFTYELDYVNAGDTTESIAKRNFYRVSTKYKNDINEYVKDLKKWNFEKIDWNHLQKGKAVYVDYPYVPYIAGATWAPNQDEKLSYDEFQSKFSLSVFYAASAGNYKELTSNEVVRSGQNFPVTIGSFGSYRIEDSSHFINSSIYWAKPTNGKIEGNTGSATNSFSIPGEFGFNLYYQYYMANYQAGVYSGYDFEKLNTFNTSELIKGGQLKNISNSIHYVTVGGLIYKEMFDLKSILKASISKSIISSSTGSSQLSGYKYILHYTLKPQGRFNFSLFYKHHTLEGATKLSIDRIGVGVGMSVF